MLFQDVSLRRVEYELPHSRIDLCFRYFRERKIGFLSNSDESASIQFNPTHTGLV